MIPKNKIRDKIRKFINKMPTLYEVYGMKDDGFGGVSGKSEKLFDGKGLFRTLNMSGDAQKVRRYIRDAEGGATDKKTLYMLMVIIDDNLKALNNGAQFVINETTYKLLDKLDGENLGVYYELVLEEVGHGYNGYNQWIK